MPEHSSRRQPVHALDAAALERLALRYVERFATSRGKLTEYLRRKIRERGWEGAPMDPATIAERMVSLGYVDDRAFAEARARGLARRGLGARRVAQAWHADGIGAEDRGALLPEVEGRALAAAIAFARRKRIGPFATQPEMGREVKEKQLAAMLRAGHDLSLSRRIVEASAGQDWFDDETIEDLRGL